LTHYRLIVGVLALITLSLVLGLCFFAAPISPTHSSIKAQIDRGEVSQNTTLFLKDSPYLFTHDVTVLPEVKLTIEAGVKIAFSPGASLIVNGSLNVVGTANAPVYFTSNDPSATVWGTIMFLGNSTESFILKYANIANATQGIVIDNEKNGNVLVQNCHIHDNQGAGIQFTTHGNITIKESTIEHNTVGISGKGYNIRQDPTELYPYSGYLVGVYLQSNTIQFNAMQGIQLSSSGKTLAEVSDILFTFNNVSCNGEDGIQVTANSGMSSFVSDINFTSNTILNNGKQGIELTSGVNGGPYGDFLYNITFSSNNISRNEGSGVHLNAAQHEESTVFDAVFDNNTFVSNSQEAILIEGGIISNITGNTIKQSVYGIFYKGTQNNVSEFNNISSNDFGMFVSDGATVQAQNNYWGDPTGPYHLTINPQGKGNTVNGNGDDLRFTPFLLLLQEVNGK
jgi:hypothetical protein